MSDYDDRVAMHEQLREIRELPCTQPDDSQEVIIMAPNEQTRREQRNDEFERLYKRRDELMEEICRLTREHHNTLDDIERLNQDEHAERHPV